MDLYFFATSLASYYLCIPFGIASSKLIVALISLFTSTLFCFSAPPGCLKFFDLSPEITGLLWLKVQ
jgi:hypothetical protein